MDSGCLSSVGRAARPPGWGGGNAIRAPVAGRAAAVWGLSGLLTLYLHPPQSTQLSLPSTRQWSEGWSRTPWLLCRIPVLSW